MSIEIEKLTNIIEAALLAFGQPLSVDRLMSLFAEEEQVGRQDIRSALQLLQQSCDGRSVELVEVGSGFRYQARKDFAKWVSKLWEEKPPRYSRALLETLVLVAYRQPITRAEIEDIRGVSVSTHIMKTLHERDWVRVVGHKDVPGKPALYATTKAFLDYFSLKSLEELPSLMEIRDLDKISAEIDKQDSEISAAQGLASAEPLDIIDGEDVERLLPDGNADHGDGIEEDVDNDFDETVAARAEYDLVHSTDFDEPGGAAIAVTVDDEETTGEQVQERVENAIVVAGELTDESAPEFTALSNEPVPAASVDDIDAYDNTDDDIAGDNFDGTIDGNSEESSASQAPSGVELENKENMEYMAATESVEGSAAMRSHDDETDSEQVDSGKTEYAEMEYTDAVDEQTNGESANVPHARFSTAEYGLRTEKHREQESDESDHAEDERDSHPDRLSAAESNS